MDNYSYNLDTALVYISVKAARLNKDLHDCEKLFIFAIPLQIASYTYSTENEHRD